MCDVGYYVEMIVMESELMGDEICEWDGDQCMGDGQISLHVASHTPLSRHVR